MQVRRQSDRLVRRPISKSTKVYSSERGMKAMETGDHLEAWGQIAENRVRNNELGVRHIVSYTWELIKF